MAKRVVDDASLTAVADAIREMDGTDEEMVFPEGFVSVAESHAATLQALLDRSITEYENLKITQLGYCAFGQCKKLKSVYLPNVVTLKAAVFQGCTELAEVYLPLLNSASTYTFDTIAASVLDFPSLKIVNSGFCRNSPNLTTVILRNPSVINAQGSSLFVNTPIASGAGYIYVPKALVDSYKSATNWSEYADQFRAIEDYPEITGGAT